MTNWREKFIILNSGMLIERKRITAGNIINGSEETERSLDKLLAEQKKELLGKVKNTIGLWRPVFYRKKVTDEDMKAIKTLIEEL